MEQNSKQGEARNVGFQNASGEYLLNIDDDDEFAPNALRSLSDELDRHPVDVLMFDYNDCVNGRLDTSLKFGNNTSEVFSGKEFLERQSISWTPWSYAIKKQFLREQKLKFCGGVLYEDVDFALGIIARSSSAKYIPLPLVRYTIRTGQTSKIGDSPVRVDYLFQLTERLNVLASQFSDSRKRIIQQQADFQLKQLVTRYLWRLKYKDIRILLSRYTGLAQRQGLANRIPFKAPVLYACLAILLGPSVKFIIKKIRG